MRLKKAVADLIECERVCRVATSGKAAVPHLVPVCHVLSGGKIYFAAEKNARKVRNLRANPRIAVAVDLYSDAWSNLRGVMVQGKAAIIGKSPRFRKIRGLLSSSSRRSDGSPRAPRIGRGRLRPRRRSP
ncbi:MAG: pyridoxamine 5'-phosphate oxidase family protein [Candidatus Binatia bacterium]